jgi:phage/plasmid-associated DNA primase
MNAHVSATNRKNWRVQISTQKTRYAIIKQKNMTSENTDLEMILKYDFVGSGSDSESPVTTITKTVDVGSGITLKYKAVKGLIKKNNTIINCPVIKNKHTLSSDNVNNLIKKIERDSVTISEVIDETKLVAWYGDVDLKYPTKPSQDVIDDKLKDILDDLHVMFGDFFELDEKFDLESIYNRECPYCISTRHRQIDDYYKVSFRVTTRIGIYQGDIKEFILSHKDLKVDWDLKPYNKSQQLINAPKCYKFDVENKDERLMPLTCQPLQEFFIQYLQGEELLIIKNPVDTPKIEVVEFEKCAVILTDLDKILNCLKSERCDDYNEWYKVGQIIWNEYVLSGYKSYDTWSKKSKKYSESYTYRKYYYQMGGNKDLTIGTLMYWAKEDNPEMYAEFRKSLSPWNEYKIEDDSEEEKLVSEKRQKKIDELVENAVKSASDWDIAKAALEILKGKFVCVSEDHNKFFTCWETNGSWVENGASILRKAFSENIHRIFIQKSIDYLQLAKDATEEDEKRLRELSKKAAVVAGKLHSEKAKDQFMKSFRTMTLDEKFRLKLDEKPELFAFNNGVMDLEKKIFRDIKPEDFISKSAGYDYVSIVDPQIRAELEKFESEILDIFTEDDDGNLEVDESKKMFMRNSIASHLYGCNKQEQVILMIGSGRNGKCVLIVLFTGAFGDYSYCPSSGIIQKSLNNPSAPNPEVRKLKGIRGMIVSEPREDIGIDISKIKTISGNDELQGRFLNENPIEFTANFGTFIQLNALPPMDSIGKSVKERFNFVSFDSTFTRDPKYINEKLIDVGLKNRFDKDIRYSQQYMIMLMETFFKNDMAHENFTLHAPDCVKADSDEIFQQMDPVASWLSTLKIEKDSVVSKSIAFDDFNLWYDNQNDSGKMMIDEKAFDKCMNSNSFKNKQHKFRVKGTKDIKTHRGYRGIIIPSDIDRQAMNEKDNENNL